MKDGDDDSEGLVSLKVSRKENGIESRKKQKQEGLTRGKQTELKKEKNEQRRKHEKDIKHVARNSGRWNTGGKGRGKREQETDVVSGVSETTARTKREKME